MKLKLRPHQVRAFERAKDRDYFALFMEQRTGKTPIAVALMEHWKPDVLILVCPLIAVASVWEKALAEWSDWLPKTIEIINFESYMRYRKRFYKLGKKYQKSNQSIMMIVDESQRMKKRGSKQSRSIRTFGLRTTKRLILTGTPISPKAWSKRRRNLKVTSGLEDLWAQYNFLNPQLFGKWEEFEAKYLTLGGFMGKKVVGYRNTDEFNEIMEEHSFHITLAESRREVGQKSAKVHRVALSFPLRPRSRKIYRGMDRELESLVNGVKVTSPLIVSSAMKLQQMTGGAVLDKTGTVQVFGSEKLEVLRTLLTDRLAGKKVVIVCRFVHEIERIQAHLGMWFKRAEVKIIRGGHKFDGTFDCQFIILQVQSGIAIDLALASHIVFFSWDHSYINYEQTRFRVLSYEKKQVSYYYLIAEDTIDEQMYESATRKQDLAKLIFDIYKQRGIDDVREIGRVA